MTVLLCLSMLCQTALCQLQLCLSYHTPGKTVRKSVWPLTCVKFADDTTISGLISGDEETTYRERIQRLVGWCAGNIVLNTFMTNDMTKLFMDFKRKKTDLQPICINGECVKSMSSFKVLRGAHGSRKWSLKWSSKSTFTLSLATLV